MNFLSKRFSTLSTVESWSSPSDFSRKCRLGVLFAALTLFMLAGCATRPASMKTEQRTEFPVDTIISTKIEEPVTFETLMDQLADVQLVFVGERHTNPTHHEIQLRIMESLYARQPDGFMVGMEMFAHTYQDVLDKWSAGTINEQELFRRTHWDVNWKFDVDLYRPLLLFTQKHRIPLIGLNVPFHIPPKIAGGGIDSLNHCEKENLPPSMDLGHSGHREYVRDIFEKHPHGGLDFKFEDFYAAQVAWEETMAYHISRNLGKHRMIAFVGNGHITHKFGIPERTAKRIQTRYLTVMPVEVGQNIDMTSADFIWITPSRTISSHSSPNN